MARYARLLARRVHYKQRVIKRFKAFSKDRKTAANTFRNPLETQFQVVSRGWKPFETLCKPFETLCKPFGNSLKPFGSPLKTRLPEFETLWKPFGNSLQTRFQEFETLWKHGFTQIAMFNKTCFRMEGHIYKCFLLCASKRSSKTV